MLEKYLDEVICGDCIEVMKEMPDKCIDAIVTDPPYGLERHGEAIKAMIFQRRSYDKITRI